MGIAWVFCGLGTIFCFTGVYLFYRNIYEKDRKILSPFLLMIMGVILIAIGTAIYVGLIS